MSAATITATAIDAHVRVDFVRVNGRHRKSLGDIVALAASIRTVGLLHPITLTRDGQLVAGERRLAACRQLGWDTVPVRYADSVTDAAALLYAERDENVCRVDMLPSELAALGAAIYELESPTGRRRQREHAGTAPGRPANTLGTRTTSVSPSPLPEPWKTAVVVGEALGMSGRTYQELRYVHNLANDHTAPEHHRDLARQALDEMDAGAGIARRARHVRNTIARTPAALPAPEPPVHEADDDPPPNGWVPYFRDNKPEAKQRRLEITVQMAERGHTSDQIGHVLGIKAATIRANARAAGLAIPADDVLGSRTRTRFDSNRVVRETVQYLADTEAALGLVDFAELDLGEVAGWVDSLTKSLRLLNRLNRTLREMAQ